MMVRHGLICRLTASHEGEKGQRKPKYGLRRRERRLFYVVANLAFHDMLCFGVHKTEYACFLEFIFLDKGEHGWEENE